MKNIKINLSGFLSSVALHQVDTGLNCRCKISYLLQLEFASLPETTIAMGSKLIVTFLGLVLFLGTYCLSQESKAAKRNTTLARQGKRKFRFTVRCNDIFVSRLFNQN